MVFEPLFDRLIVKPEKRREKTPGGLYLPPVAQANMEQPLTGYVVAIGPGHELDDGTITTMRVKVGDHILFSKFAGTGFEIDNIEHVIVRQIDVMAIIKES